MTQTQKDARSASGSFCVSVIASDNFASIQFGKRIDMVSIRDADATLLVKKTAEQLKGKIGMPAWANYVKTGVGKERPPEDPDWWYIRVASVLRRIYLDGPVGVSRLRSYYGSKHRRGHKPTHFAKGSGNIIRKSLQELEKIGLIAKTEKPRGRIITPEGQKFLNTIAKGIK